MRRNYKRKKFHVSGICIFLVLIIFSVAFVLWAMKPDNFRNEKNKINSWLNGISFQDFYNAKSLICRTTAKEKKPSQSRHIFTRLLYFGGFDYQSRRFFLSI